MAFCLNYSILADNNVNLKVHKVFKTVRRFAVLLIYFVGINTSKRSLLTTAATDRVNQNPHEELFFLFYIPPIVLIFIVWTRRKQYLRLWL